MGGFVDALARATVATCRGTSAWSRRIHQEPLLFRRDRGEGGKGLFPPPGGWASVPRPAGCIDSFGSWTHLLSDLNDAAHADTVAAQLLTKFGQGPIRLLFQLAAHLIFDGFRHPPMRRATSCPDPSPRAHSSTIRQRRSSGKGLGIDFF